jgi:hypothetical protein
MTGARQRRFFILVLTALAVLTAGAVGQQPVKSRILGTVAAVSGNSISVKTDADGTVDVTVPETARILKTAPGQRTLTGAEKLTLSGIGAGDRVLMLVRGTPPTASIVIVNKASDLASLRAKEREAWEKNGVGGLVKSVDAAAGTVTIASGARTIVIHTTAATTFRRYAPDSVKFSDAQPSTLAAIQTGNQVQALGEKSADGSEITAKELVSGAFRNIAGTVVATDGKAGTFTVKNWMNKKTLTIRTAPDTDMRMLEPRVAEMIAMRLRMGGAGAEGEAGGHGGPPAGMRAGNGAPSAAQIEKWRSEHSGPGGPPRGPASRGGGFARVLERSPEIHVADLHKGDAVMIVATEGRADEATAIRVVAGVEPMLEASAKGSQSMFSSAWSLGGGSGGNSGGGSEEGQSGQGAP